ncbi:anti-CBASS protein Acb1 family protein [Vibrio metschnikovii]|uniref:anti-CBASS protein Acb1 family protein n=1 Tax=Vibrio metschnikovii TaxID=28172 RepID=UPI0013023497|nr:anti-CBASS Acb1 family protein [Vibrio metschnikovii]
MTDKLQLAVNHAVKLMTNNNHYDSIAQSRMSLMQNGMGMDHKRSSAWCEYGWKSDLSFADLYSAYRRGGLAFSAVTKLISKCWSSFPEIIEGEKKDKSKAETNWEKSLKGLFGKRFWKALAEADKRRLVGRYSGVLIYFRDNKKWNEPVVKGKGVQKVQAVWANSIKPKTYEIDINSESYGEVAMWTYTGTLPNGARKNFDIHPDRLFILGDYTADAIGFLEPGYNALVNIEKVEGGSGESFLKNAARQLNINFDKEVDLTSLASMYGVSVSDLQDKFNEVAVEVNRGNDVLMTTQGASVTPLVANVPDPTPTYDINLQTFAASVDIPIRILVGNQQAERSSTEDNKYFNSRCQSRREMEISDEIEMLVDKFVSLGSIKPADFTVIWDDLREDGKLEKLTNAKIMSDINNVALVSGEAVFDDNEIRTEAGYEPRNDEPLPDNDPDDLEDEEAEVANPAT